MSSDAKEHIRVNLENVTTVATPTAERAGQARNITEWPSLATELVSLPSWFGNNYALRGPQRAEACVRFSAELIVWTDDR